MRFVETRLPGAFAIDLERREDHRGFFARAWCRDEFLAHGLNPDLAQANVGYSHRRGTLRGLHFQTAPHEEAKLVRCTMGSVVDVIVDLRPSSPTYCEWLRIDLSAEARTMVYVPEGVAHGYQTLVDRTELTYQTSRPYAPSHATGVRYDDPAFGIAWPLAVEAISDGDLAWPAYVR